MELLTFAPINNMVVSIGTMGFGSMPHKERNIITPTISYVPKKLDWENSLPIKVSHKVALSFTPNPLFQWYPQSKKILLNLSIIIVVVQVGAVKIYVGAVEELGKKESLFRRFLKKIHPVYDQTQGSGAVFFLLYR